MIRVSVNAKNAFAKLDALIIKVEEATQEGLNYGSESYIRTVKPPMDIGNLAASSWIIASKNPIGISLHSGPFKPARKSRDDIRLSSDFSKSMSEWNNEVGASKEPMTIVGYSAFYSVFHGEDWWRAPISNATSQTTKEVASLVRKIK